MPLIARMALPALPGLLVLASFTASRLSVTSGRKPWINKLVPILLVLSVTALNFGWYIVSWRHRTLAEAEAMAIVKQEVTSNPDKKYLLVCSDTRSPDSLSFYFSYRYPQNLRVISAETLGEKRLRSDNAFVFVHTQRSRFLESVYGDQHFDDKIESLHLPVVYAAGDVSLFRLDTMKKRNSAD